jgi:hypothetical protein
VQISSPDSIGGCQKWLIVNPVSCFRALETSTDRDREREREGGRERERERERERKRERGEERRMTRGLDSKSSL